MGFTSRSHDGGRAKKGSVQKRKAKKKICPLGAAAAALLCAAAAVACPSEPAESDLRPRPLPATRAELVAVLWKDDYHADMLAVLELEPELVQDLLNFVGSR